MYSVRQKKPLIFIFNVSINQGISPDSMKIAKIGPFKKEGDRYDSNYRPISILSVFSKILEKFIYNRLILFINKQNSLRDGKSAETASQIVTEDMEESMDKQPYLNFILRCFRTLSVPYS